MKRTLLAVIVLVVASLNFAGSPDAAQAQAVALSEGCTQLNDPWFDGTYLAAAYMGGLDFYAGEIITIEAVLPRSGPVLGNPSYFALFINDKPFAPDSIEIARADFPGTLTYFIPADFYNMIGWGVDDGNATFSISCGRSSAGPDMVDLTGAVVGSFVASTPIYYAPEAGAATTIVMEAGKTAYVYGVDASGAFYKVQLSGRFFWIPVAAMGPNYDAVWNGTPLPTTVVK